MKILVVDDSKTSLLLIKTSLEKLGHEVISEQRPKNAVKLFKTIHPDLVILDVMMEDLDGYQLAKEIRNVNLAEEWVPIIFLSGMINDESIAKGIDAGGDDYLTKPFSEVTLAAKIKAMQRIAEMRQRLYEATKQLQIANEKLHELSFTDELTKIANRRAFDQALANEWRRACRLTTENKQIALIMIDIDYFKFYNDTYGHIAGDKCLQQVAKALEKSLHRGTDFLARYGGEEFVVVLPHSSKHGSIALAETLRKNVMALDIPNGRSEANDKVVTISLGVALMEADPEKERFKLLSAADMALYEAKESGRNRVVFKADEITG